MGRGQFGATNFLFACIAALFTAAFLRVELRTSSPLVRLALFRNRRMSTGFVASTLATTVAMTTLVIGPFYLSGALHLDPAGIGVVMSTGPLVAALVGIPAGKAVDRLGAARVTLMGLIAMTSLLLAGMTSSQGILGYTLPLITLTAGFATFQTANNTRVIAGTEAYQRGLVSGLLNLSRNLGLVTGASLMGAIFVHAAGAESIELADASAVVVGAHAAFLTASALLAAAIVLTVWSNLTPAPTPSQHIF
jgi:predicted MFS family arabinose efflux permease